MPRKYVVSIVVVLVLAGFSVLAITLWGRRESAPAAGLGREAAPAVEAGKAGSAEEGIVRLTEAQMRQYGVEAAPAGSGRLRLEVVLPGEVALNADRVAHVVPRVSGVVREVRKNLGDTVRRGEIMAVLESRELTESTAEHFAARERLGLAQSVFAREEQLWQKRITPEQDYIQARNALASCRIELHLAEQKLRALGFSVEDIAKLPNQPDKAASTYEMTAPFDATIIEKHISLGEVLKEESSAFVIADLSSVWVNLDVHQKDLPLIQVGQIAAIGVGNAVSAMTGRISFLEPIAEETNRTIHARVVMSNAGGKLRPGLFVTGRVMVNDLEIPILVPNDALAMVGGKTCVFLKEGGKFRVREVVAGRTDGKSTEILQGLQAGQSYVAKGAFTVKSELGKPMEEK